MKDLAHAASMAKWSIQFHVPDPVTAPGLVAFGRIGDLRSSSVRDPRRTPIPRQEFVDALGRMIRQAGQHVGEPSLRIDIIELGGGDEGVDRSRTPAALIGASEGPISSADGDSP
jgi:hypothetical protein